jgi:cell division septation protein DedD
MVLGSRQLIGIFFLLVVILGVVFTLGYLLGRSQYDTRLRAAADSLPAVLEKSRSSKAENKSSANSKAPAASSAGPAKPVAPPRADWDFYHAGEPEKPPEHLAVPPAQPNAKTKAPGVAGARKLATPVTKTAARAEPPRPDNKTAPAKPTVSPLIPHGATVLQVAAVVRETDALAMAQALHQKKFPAFVVTPDSDNFYRVQVGPYPDAKSAKSAQKRLEKEGFNSIVKR